MKLSKILAISSIVFIFILYFILINVDFTHFYLPYVCRSPKIQSENSLIDYGFYTSKATFVIITRHIEFRKQSGLCILPDGGYPQHLESVFKIYTYNYETQELLLVGSIETDPYYFSEYFYYTGYNSEGDIILRVAEIKDKDIYKTFTPERNFTIIKSENEFSGWPLSRSLKLIIKNNYLDNELKNNKFNAVDSYENRNLSPANNDEYVDECEGGGLCLFTRIEYIKTGNEIRKATGGQKFLENLISKSKINEILDLE